MLQSTSDSHVSLEVQCQASAVSHDAVGKLYMLCTQVSTSRRTWFRHPLVWMLTSRPVVYSCKQMLIELVQDRQSVATCIVCQQAYHYISAPAECGAAPSDGTL